MDTTLTTQQGITILIFKRNDTGKMVKATFDISKLMPKDKMQKMQEIKSKVIGGTANDMQKSKFAENIQNAVNKIKWGIYYKPLHICKLFNLFFYQTCIQYRFVF
jgi:hypothetical protein